MDFKEIAGIVLQYAPILGSALGGPVGGAAGTALKYAAKAFGLSENATPEEVAQAVTTDPEAMLKLKIAEHGFLLEMKKAENEAKKMVLEDEQQERAIRGEIIKTEASGESWLTKNWRPLTMVSLVAIVISNYLLIPWANIFGAEINQILMPERIWGLIELGVGGYVIGRSGEKIFKMLKGGSL